MKASSLFLAQTVSKLYGESQILLFKLKFLTNCNHAGGHVMIWGCISFNGVDEMFFVEGNMKGKQCTDALRDNSCNSV